MKIVSFDVGLRNLAYCVLEGTTRNDVKILDWNIIDVLGEHAGVGAARCFKCKTAARYEHASEGTFACAKHAPRKTKNVTKTELTKKSPAELKADIVKIGLTTDATKKVDLVKLLYNHAKQNTWKKCVSSAANGSVLDFAPALITCLDGRATSWAKADIVAVENQPERRMYAVQAMIQMYFSMKGLKSEGVSATHKLSNIITTDDTTSSYKGRKKTGIAHAYALVPKENQEHFSKHPKKDDLADAFLQGLWVLEHKSRSDFQKDNQTT
jgi:hypothetical protein